MNFAEPTPYKEAFPAGTGVRIADREFLQLFQLGWKYHHKLQPEQLAYADRIAKVKGVAFITAETLSIVWRVYQVYGWNRAFDLRAKAVSMRGVKYWDGRDV